MQDKIRRELRQLRHSGWKCPNVHRRIRSSQTRLSGGVRIRRTGLPGRSRNVFPLRSNRYTSPVFASRSNVNWKSVNSACVTSLANGHPWIPNQVNRNPRCSFAILGRLSIDIIVILLGPRIPAGDLPQRRGGRTRCSHPSVLSGTASIVQPAPRIDVDPDPVRNAGIRRLHAGNLELRQFRGGLVQHRR